MKVKLKQPEQPNQAEIVDIKELIIKNLTTTTNEDEQERLNKICIFLERLVDTLVASGSLSTKDLSTLFELPILSIVIENAKCAVCHGAGYMTTYGPHDSDTETCQRCKGVGRRTDEVYKVKAN